MYLQGALHRKNARLPKYIALCEYTHRPDNLSVIPPRYIASHPCFQSGKI